MSGLSQSILFVKLRGAKEVMFPAGQMLPFPIFSTFDIFNFEGCRPSDKQSLPDVQASKPPLLQVEECCRRAFWGCGMNRAMRLQAFGFTEEEIIRPS